MTWLWVTPTASAAPQPPLVSLITAAPNGPFSSGQAIQVTAPANAILKPGRSLSIEECTASFSVPRPHHDQCDRRTIQPDLLRAGPDGSFTYTGYPIYALPDAQTLHESKHHLPVCDLTHACVLIVGYDLDDRGHRIWSAPFLVNPTPGDTGVDPGTGTPEVPYALVLPVLAATVIGGTLLIRRRRSTTFSLQRGLNRSSTGRDLLTVVVLPGTALASCPSGPSRPAHLVIRWCLTGTADRMSPAR